jgi:hypothetical protein
MCDGTITRRSTEDDRPTIAKAFADENMTESTCAHCDNTYRHRKGLAWPGRCPVCHETFCAACMVQYAVQEDLGYDGIREAGRLAGHRSCVNALLNDGPIFTD